MLHFFLLGGLVFAAYGWLGDNGVEGDEIVVTAGQQRSLAETFERTWRRSPSPEDMARLIEDSIRQEIAYRQGTKMRLDGDDIVIKRRLRQKLETLTEDMATLAPPSLAEQEAYFAGHAESYRTEARFSFEQIFFSTEARNKQAEQDALAMLAMLAGLQGGAVEPDLTMAGDKTMLPAFTQDESQSKIASVFGESFAASLGDLEPGQWSGPVRSSFGLHLVRITDQVAGGIPQFAEVADEIRNDIQSHRRQAAVDALYEGLRKDFVIRIEPLPPQQAVLTEQRSVGQQSP